MLKVFWILNDNFKLWLGGMEDSMAGRVTLIKSTLNSLANYVMQFIYLPLNVLKIG